MSVLATTRSDHGAGSNRAARQTVRVLSLIPSATEILAALGLADRLVGRSHECDYPPGVERLPACTGPAFATGGTSREIDERVSRLLKSALSIYELDLDMIRRLAATHIVTQDRCAVCAVSLPEVEQAVEELQGGKTEVISLQPKRLDDLWADIRRLAAAFDRDGRPLAARLAGRVEAIARKARAAARRARKRVLCLEWADPLYGAGGWLPELVDVAGGVEVIGKAGVDAARIDWPAVRAADPDVIVLAPCGFGLERTREDARLLAGKADWRALRAVQTGEVYIADGNQYFSRPGPRLVESAEILAEILHPTTFDFGHRGRAWAPLDEQGLPHL